MKIQKLFGYKKIILGLTGMLAGVLLLSSCGVSQETVDAKDQEIARLQTQLATVQQDAKSQLASSQQDAKYWTQLSTIFMP